MENQIFSVKASWRIRVIFGVQILLALFAVYWCGLPEPLKWVLAALLLCSCVFRQHLFLPKATVISSWGIFHQGRAYFPHQFHSFEQYHAFLLSLKLKPAKKQRGLFPALTDSRLKPLAPSQAKR